MAVRPLCFGVRFGDRGRRVRVRAQDGDPQRYVVEVRRQRGRGKASTTHREHASLSGALRDFAQLWRSRLN